LLQRSVNNIKNADKYQEAEENEEDEDKNDDINMDTLDDSEYIFD
jgi:hypothetical protein